MEFRKSIINDNGLTRRNDHLPYSVKKIKILIVKSKMVALWNPWILGIFRILNLGLRHYLKRLLWNSEKGIINYNELTRGYVHLVYSVKKWKILIVKSKMATVLKLFEIVNFRFLWFLDCNIWFREMHARLDFFTLPGPVRLFEAQTRPS